MVIRYIKVRAQIWRVRGAGLSCERLRQAGGELLGLMSRPPFGVIAKPSVKQAVTACQ